MDCLLRLNEKIQKASQHFQRSLSLHVMKYVNGIMSPFIKWDKLNHTTHFRECSSSCKRVKHTVIYSGVNRQSDRGGGFTSLCGMQIQTDLGFILHKDKERWIFGRAWGTFLCPCTLISTSQGPLPQQGRLAGVTALQGSCCNPKLNAVRALDVPKTFLWGVYSKTECKLFDSTLCTCLCVCCCAPGEWKHRQQHWWSPADRSAESSAARISERNQELCPPSATEVSAITEPVFVTQIQYT